MAVEVRDLTIDKLFKIAKLNLRGRAKEWFRRLQSVPADWAELRTLMVQKYGKAWAWDQCRSVATDNGKFAAENEDGYDGADGIMAEEIADGDDYADWIRWVSDTEKSRQTMYKSTHNVPVPLLLQQQYPEHDSAIPMLLQTVQVKDGDSGREPIEKERPARGVFIPDEEAVSTGDEPVQYEETRIVPKRRKPQYLDMRQQLDLVLAAQELSEFGDQELSPTKSDHEKDHEVELSCVDIWEDTDCLTLLREGTLPDAVDFEESKRIRKRASNYCWKE
ncbi:unnamed protein product [Sphagnum balticum]